ncbi:hypothetical protein ACLQ18_43715 [Streptomyces sp. DT193]|uniref:hypothetical protein n=1 Tax=Streptomyces sp. DT193 TaxID=3393418 RepID=UPI003CF639B2
MAIRPQHLSRWGKRRTETICHLRKRIAQQGHNVPGEFLQGAAYKLVSGAVTVIILWWEARH